MANKKIFFDTGPIITLIMSGLGRLLPLLKKQFGGEFYFTPAVHRELIERPLTMKRFKFEALQALNLLHEGVFTLYEEVPQKKVQDLQRLANTSFFLDHKNIDILQSGELESVTAALQTGAQAVVIDERTLRLSIEHPRDVASLLEHRFQKEIISKQENIIAFSKAFEGMKIIRSVELIAAAFQLGLLDGYVPEQKNGREELLDGVLWAAKLNGAAVTEEEIEEIKMYLLDHGH